MECLSSSSSSSFFFSLQTSYLYQNIKCHIANLISFPLTKEAQELKKEVFKLSTRKTSSKLQIKNGFDFLLFSFIPFVVGMVLQVANKKCEEYIKNKFVL